MLYQQQLMNKINKNVQLIYLFFVLLYNVMPKITAHVMKNTEFLILSISIESIIFSNKYNAFLFPPMAATGIQITKHKKF